MKRITLTILALFIIFSASQVLAAKNSNVSALEKDLKDKLISGKISAEDHFDLKRKINDLKLTISEANEDSKLTPGEEARIDRGLREINNELKQALIKGQSKEFKTPQIFIKQEKAKKRQEIEQFYKKANSDNKIDASENAHLLELQLELSEIK